MACALLAKSHGAGRYALEDIVIPEIGFVFHVAQGMQVQENQPILTFYHNRELSENEHMALQTLIQLSSQPCKGKERLISIVE